MTTFSVGDGELRATRRDQVFGAMEETGLGALVLGRRDSVAYATGVRSLWTAGTRPFGPACVLVGEGRSVHLLSTWDEGVPSEVPFEHLFGLTWNPAVVARSLAAVPGLAAVGRLGVDGLSVGLAGALRRTAPGAELVAADGVLAAVRAAKSAGEVERIRAAVGVAAVGVEVAAGVLVGGGDPDEALAAALRAVADRGATVPSSTPVVQDVGEGLARLDVGVLVDGYEGGVGRTVALGEQAAGDARLGAVRTAHGRLVQACRPAATGHELRAAAAAHGLTGWMVRGSGMGFEHPVVTDEVGASAVLAEGMVVSVEAEVGGARRRDLVLVGPEGAEVLA